MNNHNNVQVADPAHAGATVVAVDRESRPALEDLRSVGTRIRWGAILAGASLALGIYFLLGILGAAVGLSISDKMNPATLTNGAIAWAVFTTCTALFVGGVVASVFTVGENKVEAMLYGIIMWSVLLAFFVSLGAAGVHTGFNSLADLSNRARTGTAPPWEARASEAGVPVPQNEQGNAQRNGDANRNTPVSAESVTRITWYSFLGVWLSMFAAAAGAVVGAGPTFRLVSGTIQGRGTERASTYSSTNRRS